MTVFDEYNGMEFSFFSNPIFGGMETNDLSSNYFEGVENGILFVVMKEWKIEYFISIRYIKVKEQFHEWLPFNNVLSKL